MIKLLKCLNLKVGVNWQLNNIKIGGQLPSCPYVFKREGGGRRNKPSQYNGISELSSIIVVLDVY